MAAKFGVDEGTNLLRLHPNLKHSQTASFPVGLTQGVQDLCGFAVEAFVRGSLASAVATTLGSTGLRVGSGTVSACSQAIGGTGVPSGHCGNA